MKAAFPRSLCAAGLGLLIALSPARADDAVTMLKQAADLAGQASDATAADQRRTLIDQALRLTREAPERRLKGHRVAAIQALQRALDEIARNDSPGATEDLRQAQAELKASLALAVALAGSSVPSPTVQHAASIGDLAKVQELIGTDPALASQKDDVDITPLQAAITGAHEDVVQWLLEHGADPNARNKQGKTPLMLACEQHSAKLVGLLLDKGANPNLAVSEGAPGAGQTPLFIAVMFKDDPEVCRLLLAHGANIQAALHYAWAHQFNSIVDTLNAYIGVQPTTPVDGLSPGEVIARLVGNASRKPMGPVQEDVSDENLTTAQGLSQMTGDRRPPPETVAASYNRFSLQGPLAPLYAQGTVAIYGGKAKLTPDAVKDYRKEHASDTDGASISFAPALSDFANGPVPEDGQVYATFPLIQQHGRWKVVCVYYSVQPLQGRNLGFVIEQLEALGGKK